MKLFIVAFGSCYLLIGINQHFIIPRAFISHPPIHPTYKIKLSTTARPSPSLYTQIRLLCNSTSIMKINEQMEGSVLNWNKENNYNYNNTLLRKKNLKTLTLSRPTTPIFQATFNPFPPNNNGFSIPLIVSKRRKIDTLIDASQSNDIKEGLFRMNLKEKPVIARSHKLKDFFTHQSARYLEGESGQNVNGKQFRGRSLNALSIRRQSLQELAYHGCKASVQTRKQQFKQLYLKQRQAYERLLIKYGVLQSIEDQQFNKFVQ